MEDLQRQYRAGVARVEYLGRQLGGEITSLAGLESRLTQGGEGLVSLRADITATKARVEGLTAQIAQEEGLLFELHELSIARRKVPLSVPKTGCSCDAVTS